jgi:hypothetical protein
MQEEDVDQENLRTPRRRRQKQSFQWTNPKQQRHNIKMSTKKKLHLTEDMQHVTSFVRGVIRFKRQKQKN